jgi:hypothetical protein
MCSYVAQRFGYVVVANINHKKLIEMKTIEEFYKEWENDKHYMGDEDSWAIWFAEDWEKYKQEQLRIANVSKSLPTEDAKFIYSLLPDWVKNKAPERLDPTMYGTLSKEGDDEIQERVKQILGNVC